MRDEKSNPGLSRKEQYWICNFKWDIAAECRRYGSLPPLTGCDTMPRCLVSIHEFGKVKWPGAFVHSFRDDYKFDGQHGIWRDTERFIAKLLRWRMGMLTPDFSTYGDAHPEICRWNRFRSRLVGYHLEKRRVPVIPTLIWWDDESADEAANGLRKGGVYAISTINNARSAEERRLLGERARRVGAALDPKAFLVYGTAEGIDWGGVDIHVFPNGTYDWTRSFGESRLVV